MAKEQVFEVTIRGVRPLVMHNSELSDPLNKHSQEIKRLSKMKIDETDKAARMSRAEFEGGLYWDPDLGPVIPAENVEKCLRDGAADERRGKDTQSDLEITSADGLDVIPLEYDGPRDVDKLFADARFVFRKSAKVKTSRVMRTRPRFPAWTATFHVKTHSWASLGADVIERCLRTAGARKGLGDWRPRYGLFEVTSFAKV